MISLELMTKENSIEIYFFEKENQKYFEQNLPARPINYFDLESFKEITNELLVEQDNREVYMHLIRDFQGVIVGRINLTVFGNDKKTAELGYRIGKNYTNLGYASEAVKIVLDKAFNIYGLNKIIAGTATDNFASKRVLLKNGFTFSKIIENDLQINNSTFPQSFLALSRSEERAHGFHYRNLLRKIAAVPTHLTCLKKTVLVNVGK